MAVESTPYIWDPCALAELLQAQQLRADSDDLRPGSRSLMEQASLRVRSDRCMLQITGSCGFSMHAARLRIKWAMASALSPLEAAIYSRCCCIAGHECVIRGRRRCFALRLPRPASRIGDDSYVLASPCSSPGRVSAHIGRGQHGIAIR
jgi:hypothetical protein